VSIRDLIPSFGNKKRDKPVKADGGVASQTPEGGNRPSNQPEKALKDPEEIDFRVYNQEFSTQGTSNHLNVARSPLIRRWEKGIELLENKVNSMIEDLGEDKKRQIQNDIEVLEQSNRGGLPGDHSREEKVIVSCWILHQRSMQVKELTEALFEVSNEIGDTNYQEPKRKAATIYKDVYTTVRGSIHLYRYIFRVYSDIQSRKSKRVAKQAASVYMNSVKAFSAASADMGMEIASVKEWTGWNPEDIEEGRGVTIFQQFFDEPLR
jgi:hypothetical protein